MKERPILFSAPMVQALLNGSKTQTRRVVKPSPIANIRFCGGAYIPTSKHGDIAVEAPHIASVCPYGQPGDRLWVRETTVNVEEFGYLGPVYAESEHGRNVLEYGLAPSEDDFTEVEPEDLNLRPSIFMPRAMSRITLEITGVRVERLQEISAADAQAEGIVAKSNGRYHCGTDNDGEVDCKSPVTAYAWLWNNINGPDSWAANPWVWVIEFKQVTP